MTEGEEGGDSPKVLGEGDEGGGGSGGGGEGTRQGRRVAGMSTQKKKVKLEGGDGKRMEENEEEESEEEVKKGPRKEASGRKDEGGGSVCPWHLMGLLKLTRGKDGPVYECTGGSKGPCEGQHPARLSDITIAQARAAGKGAMAHYQDRIKRAIEGVKAGTFKA